MGPVYFDNFFTVGNCIDILTTAAYIGPVEVRMPYNRITFQEDMRTRYVSSTT